MDKDKLAQENKAIGVFLNPPHYWMFDEFRVFEIGDDRTSCRRRSQKAAV